jgi:hypothetical protein
LSLCYAATFSRFSATSRQATLAAQAILVAPKLTVGVNALNVTNRVNLAGYVGNLNSPLFGQAVFARPSRRLQLSLQFAF